MPSLRPPSPWWSRTVIETHNPTRNLCLTLKTRKAPARGPGREAHPKLVGFTPKASSTARSNSFARILSTSPGKGVTQSSHVLESSISACAELHAPWASYYYLVENPIFKRGPSTCIPATTQDLNNETEEGGARISKSNADYRS